MGADRALRWAELRGLFPVMRVPGAVAVLPRCSWRRRWLAPVRTRRSASVHRP
ncbi:hypothetical protein KPATCC21470_0179 [Kitasatospora purpeofusca]